MKSIDFEEDIVLKTQTKKHFLYFDKNYFKFFISERKLRNKQYMEVSRNIPYERRLHIVINAYNRAIMTKQNSDLIFYLLSYINSY